MRSLRSMMRHRYVSATRKRWAAFGKVRIAKRWARSAFAEFEASPAKREQMLSSVAIDALHLGKLADKLAADRDGARGRFVNEMLQACQHVDSGDVWHRTAKLRSYVDVSVQAKALCAFAEYLSTRKAFVGDATSLAANTAAFSWPKL